MKSDKNQTVTLISVAMILIGAVIIIVSLSMPRVYDSSNTAVTESAGSTAISQSSSQSNNTVSGSSKYDTKGSYDSSSSTASVSSSASQSDVSYPLNLNTCTAEELATIKGVGDVRANSIIAYRQKLGKYTSVEQLKDIKGIGDGLFAKIAPFVTV